VTPPLKFISRIDEHSGIDEGAHSMRRLVPAPIRRAAAQAVAAGRAFDVERQLAALARDTRPIIVGPWLGEVGFELLYWIPFLRWFTGQYAVHRDRVICVSRGGASVWYSEFASRSHDVLGFMTQEEFRHKNAERAESLGEQKQIASTPVEDHIVALVRQREESDAAVLHPSMMYRLFAPYWWGHRPMAWIRRYTHFAPVRPPSLPIELPGAYTAVKFYFNDCFKSTAENRAFVERTIRQLAEDGPVISLSTGVTVDDHSPCEPDVAAMQEIRHLLSPQTNLAVQSAIVARARRFVGTYGGFAYLAPLSGVSAVSYYSVPGSFSTRHLDLVRDVLGSSPDAGRLEVARVPQEARR
jgi:hypothetical protein